MNFFILILLLCFIIFLFIIYILSHDDFIILRRDVSMEKVFNAAFLVSLVTIFSARFFYVFFNPNSLYLSPLGFLLFPYFPGLSLAGALLGGSAFLLFYLKLKNLPVGRLFDFFGLGFLISFPVGFVGQYFLSGNRLSIGFFVSLLLIIATVAVFIKFVLPLTLGGKLKDASLGASILASLSLLSIIINVIENRGLVLSGEFTIFIVMLVSSVVFLVKQVAIVRLQDKK